MQPPEQMQILVHTPSPPTRPILPDDSPAGSNINDAKDHLNQCTWTHFNFAAKPQKWLRPSSQRYCPPIICKPYVSATHTKSHPPKWTNWKIPHYVVHRGKSQTQIPQAWSVWHSLHDPNNPTYPPWSKPSDPHKGENQPPTKTSSCWTQPPVTPPPHHIPKPTERD